MRFIPVDILSEVIIIEPDAYGDDRGYFLETFQVQRYSEYGITDTFVQDNQSFSMKNVLRGLHYQLNHPQGKLVRVVQGKVLDVAVDIRLHSPTFGKWISVVLSSENHRQLYIPEGFAHGFCVLSESAFFCYKCTDYYDASSEHGIIWNDPNLNIDWKITNPVLSIKDTEYPGIDDVPEKDLPIYKKN